MAVIDRGDEITKEHIHRFAGQVDIHAIDIGNLGHARNYGIERIDTKYVATFDGDDLFDRDWLWKGVQFLEELNDDRAMGHTQVRLTFGTELYGRLHLASDSPLFHPLHLITSWQYAADVIAPTALYKQYPLMPNDHEHGLAAEDWFWTCESLVEGIRHRIIPETVYYYRRQASHLSLGMVPGVTFHPTRLLDKTTIEKLTGNTSPSTAILLAGSLDSVTGPIERWTTVPQWLKQSVLRACELDLGIYDLHRALPTLTLETPPFYPAVEHLYLKLMGMIATGRPLMVVFTDRLNPDTLGIIDAFLAIHKAKGTSTPDILIISLSQTSDINKADGRHTSHPDMASSPRWDGSGPRLIHFDLGNDPAFSLLWNKLKEDLIVRFLMQTRPELTVNMDSEFFDNLIGVYGKAIASSPAQTVRICCDVEDDTLAGWQALSLGNGHYTMALCRNALLATRLNRYFNGTGMAIYSCIMPNEAGRFRALGEGLCNLLSPHQEKSKVKRITTLPPFHRASNKPSSAKCPDVSCILPVQLEGHHLNQTLRSLAAMCAEARRNHIHTEVIIVADHAGPRTKNVLTSLSRTWPEARIIETELDNKGAVLNAGIAAAMGQWVALMDGTAMISPNWLTRAVTLAKKNGVDAAIIHPHAVIEHGENLQITYQPDMNGFENSIESLVAQEVWTATALASRELFIRYPYHTFPEHSGYGHVTWHWNCETVMAGCRHLVVEDTLVYQRPQGFAGEYRVRLGLRPEITLPPTRFFSEQPWLHRKTKNRGYVQRKVETTLSKVLALMNRILKRRRGLSLPPGWDDEEYLKASADVQLAVAAGLFPSGYAHYCRHGHTEARRTGWKIEHLLETLRAFSTANPAFKVADSEEATVRTVLSTAPADVYRSCREIISASQPTHLFLSPSLRPGGSELVMIHTIEAVLTTPTNRVLVITTENSDQRWLHRLPPRQCAWLPFADLAGDLSHEEKIRILTTLLINSGARCLHMFFSALGWQILRSHTPALAQQMRIFVSLFAIPPAVTGMDIGYSRFIGSLYPHLAGIFTDNQRMADQLQTLCGIPPEKIKVLRHPAIAQPRVQRLTEKKRPVLWANRIDHDKRPELLIEIARQLPAVSFHVYGEPVLNGKECLDNLLKIPNIDYRGKFNGFDSIASEPYMCLLHTTYWEGLPNTILEAMKAGLLVVAPDVGGIAEVVGKDSGILIRDANDVTAYVKALEKIYSDPESHRVLAETGSRRIAENYNQAAFSKALSAIPCYL